MMSIGVQIVPWLIATAPDVLEAAHRGGERMIANTSIPELIQLVDSLRNRLSSMQNQAVTVVDSFGVPSSSIRPSYNGSYNQVFSRDIAVF